MAGMEMRDAGDVIHDVTLSTQYILSCSSDLMINP